MRRYALVPTLAAAAALTPLAAPALFAQTPGTDIFVGRLGGEGASVTVSSVVNVTARAGYDNQPGFTPDSRSILFTSQRDGQTDIYRYEVVEGRTTPVTTTAESEYSATPMPGGGRFSTIRVEADSTQRLWSFTMAGEDPQLVFPDIAPAGYHAWLDDDTAALFVLGRPATLVIADVGGNSRTRAHDIGRSLHRIPGRAAVSFLHQDGGVPRIRALDIVTGAARDLAPPIEGAADYAWTPSGVLLMGSGSTLYAFDPLTDSVWREVADLTGAGVTGITRLAVSPDGTRIAIVGNDPS
jgi:hypothetical protein